MMPSPFLTRRPAAVKDRLIRLLFSFVSFYIFFFCFSLILLTNDATIVGHYSSYIFFRV